MNILLHEEITQKIIHAFYQIYNSLGYGFLEKVYENAMVIELGKMDLIVQQQKAITVFYDKIPESDNIFTISDSSLIIKGITLISENFRKNCFDSENSVIVFDNSDLIFNCSNFINQRNSSTIIEDSSLTLKSRLNSTAFNNYLSTLKIDTGSIDIYSESDITGFRLLKSQCYLTDSSFSFKSSRAVYSFNLENSALNMKNIRVKNISKELSHTVISDKSRINITDSFISDAEGASESLHFKLNKYFEKRKVKRHCL